MQFPSINQKVWDLIIIGGGITGANVLWDATLRGLKVLLLEKNDYSSGTSQATSKLIHGGLRYLKNLEFGLVKESLLEKKYLATMAPFSLKVLPMMIPLYSLKEKLIMGAGMRLAEFLSFGKNSGVMDDCKILPFQSWSKNYTLIQEPNLKRKNLKGAYVYYDYANVNPDRLTCEFIFASKELGNSARNYTKVQKVTKEREGSLFKIIAERVKNFSLLSFFLNT